MILQGFFLICSRLTALKLVTSTGHSSWCWLSGQYLSCCCCFMINWAEPNNAATLLFLHAKIKSQRVCSSASELLSTNLCMWTKQLSPETVEVKTLAWFAFALTNSDFLHLSFLFCHFDLHTAIHYRVQIGCYKIALKWIIQKKWQEQLIFFKLFTEHYRKWVSLNEIYTMRLEFSAYLHLMLKQEAHRSALCLLQNIWSSCSGCRHVRVSSF